MIKTTKTGISRVWRFPLTLGVILGWTAISFAQSPPKVLVGQGFTLCLDVEAPSTTAAQAYSYTISVDGGTVQAANGMEFNSTATTGVVEVQFPLDAMPLAAQAIGIRSVQLAASSGPIILADGSTWQPPASSITVVYEVLDPNLSGPALSNPRWKRLSGGQTSFFQ